MAIKREWTVGDIADAHRMLSYWSAVYEDNAPDPDDFDVGPGANSIPSHLVS